MDRRAISQKLKSIGTKLAGVLTPPKFAQKLGQKGWVALLVFFVLGMGGGGSYLALTLKRGSVAHDEPAKPEAHAKADADADAAEEEDEETSDVEVADEKPAARKPAQHKKTADVKPVEDNSKHVPKVSLLDKLAQPYKDAWGSVQTKMDRLREADEENSKLRLENANLRLKTESLLFDCRAKDADRATKEFQLKLTTETGTKVGRTLASISYRPPVHLLPPQLYTLAVSYFKGREDEKAAVILTLLTDLEENDSYKTAKNYLMTGVAWYRMDNLELADRYFAKVLDMKDTNENLPHQAQSRLWRALVSERANVHLRAQHWLRELVDYHPRSIEAAWINAATAKKPATEVKRVPAEHEKSE